MTTDDIKQLRALTGAGIVEAKGALDEAGSLDAAVEMLRKRGKKVAEKKAGRMASEGVIDAYVHPNGKVASVVALACETDFVARNAEFKALAHEIALHVAALGPAYLAPADVPADIVEKEREIAREAALAEGKPAGVVEKIVEGKIEKFYDDYCLLRQPFVKDDQLTVGELIEAAVAKIGEKIEIRHFSRVTL